MIPDELIRKLVKQAVELNKIGKRVVFKRKPKKPVVLPGDMRTELKAHGLEKIYKDKPYYQQRGYVQWIKNAKRSETRTARIMRMIEELKTATYMAPKREQ